MLLDRSGSSKLPGPHLKNSIVAAAAAALVGLTMASPANADATASAGATFSLKFTLTDLDPSDGVTPSLTRQYALPPPVMSSSSTADSSNPGPNSGSEIASAVGVLSSNTLLTATLDYSVSAAASNSSSATAYSDADYLASLDIGGSAVVFFFSEDAQSNANIAGTEVRTFSNAGSSAVSIDFLGEVDTTAEVDPVVSAVPEPAGVTLLIAGLALMGLAGRRRKG